jgi:hypothetical protein
MGSHHGNTSTTSPHNMGLGHDTSGANDFPASNERDRDPHHVYTTDRVGTGALLTQSHLFLENVKVMLPLPILKRARV